MSEIKCKICTKSLPSTDFYYRKDTQKYETTCKKCRNKNARNRKKNNLVKKRVPNNFCCLKCNIQKTPVDFYLKDKKKNRYSTICKECHKITTKNWHKENKEKSLENKKKWHTDNRDYLLKKMRENHKKKMETNPEHEREIRKLWKEKNIEKVREYHKNKYRLDVNYRVGNYLRDRCRKSIIDGSFSLYLGCHGYFAKRWLEFQFKDGMTWDNYGDVWCIDHVIPVNNFDLESVDQQLECFNWQNIQPLTYSQNLKKSTTNPTDKEVEKRFKLIEDFLKPLVITI